MAHTLTDAPLAEITLRKYENPVNLSKRDIANRICLSVGLLQPGDSRDVIVDILEVILNSKKPLTSKQIEHKVIKSRKSNKLPMQGITASNIRRQLRRLKSIYIIESVLNTYRVSENAKLRDIFDEKICKFYLESIVWRIREHFEVADNLFKRK